MRRDNGSGGGGREQDVKGCAGELLGEEEDTLVKVGDDGGELYCDEELEGEVD